MRQHKYRAWHKTKHKMMLFELSELNDSMITKPEEGWYLEDCELMEWTGFNDKNGTPMYECDVLQTNWGMFEVFWREEFAGFYLRKLDEDWIELIGMTGNVTYGVIIGNSYELHELLKSEGKQ